MSRVIAFGCSEVKPKIHVVAFAPSSPHRLVDLARAAYSFNFVDGFIVVKPVSLAAQIGVPEVFKIAYKYGRSFYILANLRELKEILNIDTIVFILQNRKEVQDFSEVVKNTVMNSIAIIVQAGETTINKDDLSLGIVARICEMSDLFSPNPVAEVTAVLMKLLKILSSFR
jgi:SpoU rRNA methylase family enzyme